MKALVATTRTQGTFPGDFTWTVPGELVMIGMVCSRDERDPDGPDACGCGRAFAGLNSRRATTTAEVREVDLTEADFWEAVRSGMEQAGVPLLDAELDEFATELADIADRIPTGTVLGRRVDSLIIREPAPGPESEQEGDDIQQ